MFSGFSYSYGFTYVFWKKQNIYSDKKIQIFLFSLFIYGAIVKVYLIILILEDCENIADENTHKRYLVNSSPLILFSLTGKKIAVILELKRKKP